jgi:hypothetical protein
MLKQVQQDGRVLRSTRPPLNQPPLDPQISPVRVVGLDQIDFPLPMPILQLLLARNRVRHPIERLGMDEADHAVVSRKSRRRLVAMLPQSRREVGRDADVERTAFLAGEDVSAGLSHLSVDTKHHSHAELVSASMPQSLCKARYSQIGTSSEAWVLKQVQDDCDA